MIYNTNKTISTSTYPNDIVNQDPLFINVVNYDFHLTPTSPAINNGTVISGFNYDKDGISRPQGCCWDIGAYEYVQAAEPPDTTPPSPPKGLTVI